MLLVLGCFVGCVLCCISCQRMLLAKEEVISEEDSLVYSDLAAPEAEVPPAEGGSSVQTWVASEAAQGLVGQPLGRLKEAFQLACPKGSLSVDFPGGPKKKRGPSANRLIANTDGKGDGAVVQRVWGYFPKE